MRKSTNKTSTNKLVALMVVCVGILSIFIDGDLTGLLLGFLMGVPLFLAKENVIL